VTGVVAADEHHRRGLLPEDTTDSRRQCPARGVSVDELDPERRVRREVDDASGARPTTLPRMRSTTVSRSNDSSAESHPLSWA
jgi:hypothetical protein